MGAFPSLDSTNPGEHICGVAEFALLTVIYDVQACALLLLHCGLDGLSSQVFEGILVDVKAIFAVAQQIAQSYVSRETTCMSCEYALYAAVH
jgi:hypothetical protein